MYTDLISNCISSWSGINWNLYLTCDWVYSYSCKTSIIRNSYIHTCWSRRVAIHLIIAKHIHFTSLGYRCVRIVIRLNSSSWRCYLNLCNGALDCTTTSCYLYIVELTSYGSRRRCIAWTIATYCGTGSCSRVSLKPLVSKSSFACSRYCKRCSGSTLYISGTCWICGSSRSLFCFDHKAS